MRFLGRKKANKLLEEGIELHKRGDRDSLRRAEIKYIESLEYDPNNPSTHLNYGDLLKKTGRPRAAELEYKKAMIMAPDQSEPHASLGALYHSQSRYEEAEREYESALSKNPGNINVKLNLAQLYMDTVRYTEMKKLYQEILKYVKDPNLKSVIEGRLR